MHRSIRRLRRLRAVLLRTVVLGALAGGLLVVVGAVAPASAAPALTLTHAIPGNTTVSVSWHAVPHTVRYTMRVSRHAAMSGATEKHAALTHAVLHGLKNGRALWVQVTAERTTGQDVRSALRRITPEAGRPTPVSDVTATAAGANQVLVHWSGGGPATHVAVAAGADVLVTSLRFHSNWLPATTRSVLLTVPPALRAQLGATSGEPVFVRVLQTNSTIPHAVKGTATDAATALQVSDPGPWALAGPPAPSPLSSQLTVGELNVQSVGASKGFTPIDRWSAREPRVVATIERWHPELLTTAELSTSLVQPCAGGNHPAANIWCSADAQYMDLAQHLASGAHPYALATPDAFPEVHMEMLQHPAWKAHVTDGAHIFYDPTKLQLDDHGFISPVFDLGVPGWTRASGVDDRWVSWAQFTMLDGTGRRFIAVASHFPVGDTAAVIAIRAQEATRLIAYLDRLNTDHLPIVFTGDMNADPVREADAAPTAFIRAGYFDAAATTNRVGIQYDTQNTGNGDDGPDNGYPHHVWPRTIPSSRIDYILLKGSPNTFAYANVLALKGTAFVHKYQGSDHNLQLATIGIGAPGQ